MNLPKYIIQAVPESEDLARQLSKILHNHHTLTALAAIQLIDCFLQDKDPETYEWVRTSFFLAESQDWSDDKPAEKKPHLTLVQ